MDATTDKPTSSDQKPACEQFLCEACGYSLEGLDAMSSKCPECGKPARESLPSARIGTPWQIKPGPISYVWTVYLVLTQPRTIWDGVRLDRACALSLVVMTVLLAGVGGSILILMGIGHPWYIARFSVAFTLVLTVLTGVEMLGLYVFGRRHGFRMTGNVPLVICAHAAGGWWVSILGMALVTRATQFVVIAHLAGASWLGGHVVLFGQSISRIAVLVALAFLVGMVIYSLLAGAGYHRLRYVNRPGIEQDRGVGTD